MVHHKCCKCGRDLDVALTISHEDKGGKELLRQVNHARRDAQGQATVLKAMFEDARKAHLEYALPATEEMLPAEMAAHLHAEQGEAMVTNLSRSARYGEATVYASRVGKALTVFGVVVCAADVVNAANQGDVKRAVVKGVSGASGFLGGFASGAATGAALGAAGFNPFTVAVGSFFGGLIGGIGTAFVTEKVTEIIADKNGMATLCQDCFHELLDVGVRDHQERQRDEEERERDGEDAFEEAMMDLLI